MPTLNPSSKWIIKIRSFKVRDIVLLAEEHKHRDEWSIMVVKEYHERADG